MFKRFATGLLCTAVYASQALASGANTAPLAPGYGALDYVPPAPGSYSLPVLGNAPDGAVLDESGQPRRLRELLAGHISLLGFVYSNCSDVNGCPLSSYVFYRIKAAMQHDPWLAKNLALHSLSFDPRRDTPEVMRLYGANFRYAGPAGTWNFLTTRSQDELAPILAGYRQDLQQRLTDSGATDYAHLLRVYLIDARQRIRNIYSVAFLHPEVLLNDVRTLLMETDSSTTVAAAEPLAAASLSRPGDDKQGYDRADYRTDSQAVSARTGAAADLLAYVRNPPLGLPPAPVPAENPLTAAKVSLGRKLFFDRRLSLNGTFSCAMCHVPEQGFTSNELATAVGVEGRTVRRNSPSLYNVAYATSLFHDAREENLEQQIWGPLLARNEMANPSVGFVLERIRGLRGYAGRFEAVFPGRGLSMETLGMAIASYQRTLISGDSPFDRYQYGGKISALGDAAKRGLALFTGKAGCAACHLIGPRAALFTDNKLHNTGIGYGASMGIRPAKKKIALAPGVFVAVDQSVIDSVGEPPPADVGRYEITQNPADRWKYRTPSLRNVALSAPYMHNGSLSGLRDVVEFYNNGGLANPLLDPAIRPLDLSGDEIDDLVTFLESLTGSNVDAIVADAFAAPIGDPDEDADH